jgi:hypothetical protein
MEPTSTPTAQTTTTATVSTSGVVTVSSGGRHADLPAGAPPELVSSSSAGTAAHTTITLTFNTTMAAGSGTIYVTDGAVQTVIDRATGLPAMRIVGATDTHAIAAGSVHVDGAVVTIDAAGLLAGHNYSVVMDAGVLYSASHRVFGGLRSASGVVISTPTGDTQAPTLASIELDGATLSVGHDIAVTIRFSEAVTLPGAAINAPNASINKLHTTDDGHTWTATLTGAAATTSPVNTLGIDMSQVRDAAGNAGSGTSSASVSYKVDTVAPAAPVITLDGAALDASHAIGLTARFAEVVTLDASAFTTPHASVTGLHTIDGGRTWVATLATTDTGTSSGNAVSLDMAAVTDLAGNHGSGAAASSARYSVNADTTAPVVSSVVLDSSTLASGETIGVTIRFSEPVATLDPAALVAEHATVSDLATTDGGLTWHAVLHAPLAPTSAPGSTLSIDMSMVRDAQGNAGTGLMAFGAYAVDTAPPTAALTLSGAQLSTTQTVDATIIFAEAVTGLSAGSFSAPNATVSNVASTDGGRAWHATLTGASDTNVLSAASALTLDLGTVRDMAGNAGTGTVSSLTGYYVDTRAPAAVALELGRSALGPGGTMQVTFTFSEEITELNAAAIVAPHATVGGLIHVAANTWRATLTGTDAAPSSGNQVSIDMAQVRDPFGNSGSGIVHSAGSYAIDGGAPTVTAIALNGTLLNTHQSIGVTIQFSEAVPDLTAAAIVAPNATVTGLHTDDSITWQVLLTGTADTASTGGIVGIDMSRVHDAAGNAGSGIAHAAQSYEVDTRAPAVVGAIGLDSTAIGIDDFIVATINFSEKVYLPGEAISAPNATVYAAYPSDDTGTTWQVILIAAASGTDAPVNQLTVDLGKVSDWSGNQGSGTFSSGNYAVDTTLHVDFYDSGWSDSDAITNDGYLSGSFVTRGSEGSTVKLEVDGAPVPAGDVQVSHSSELGHGEWNSELDLEDGVHHIRVWLEDADGNRSAVGSQDITVDTTRPTLLAPNETSTPLDVAAPLQIQFSEAVYWDAYADGDNYGTVNLYNNDTEVFTQVYVDDRNLSADRKTLIINADDLHLTGGGHYRLTLNGSLADAAGNYLGENEIGFQTAGTYTDDTAPTALRAEAGTHSSWWGDSYRAGTVIDITIRLSEPVRLVEGATPSLTLNTGGVANFHDIGGDGREVNFRYTVGASDGDTPRLAIADSSALVGAFADLAGHTLDAAHIDYSALEASPNGYGNDIISIDTHAPGTLTGVILDADSDRGDLDNDHITSDATPTLYGSGAEPDALELRIYDNGHVVGYGYSDEDGSWWATVNAGASLAEGNHLLSVTQVDQAGNESPLSSALAITIDTTGPAAAPGAPVLAPASDSGTPGDGITSDSTPTFTGAGAEPNRIVRLYANEREVGHAVSDASGAWSITVSEELSDRSYSFGVKQFDLAGNKSAYSDSVTVTISTAPAILALSESFARSMTYGGEAKPKTTFAPGTQIQANGAPLAGYAPGDVNWAVSDIDIDNGMWSTGLVHVQAKGASVPDFTGDAAIIGSAAFDFRIDLMLL